MLYHKSLMGDGHTVLTEIYEDEIVTFCPTCGKEHQLEPKEIAEIIQSGHDFSGTSIYCKGCMPKEVF